MKGKRFILIFHFLVISLLVSFLISGCGSGGGSGGGDTSPVPSVSPSASITPTPTSTVSPAPSPSVTTSPSPKPSVSPSPSPVPWTKCFGGTKEDRAFSIIQTTDGSYLAVGTTASDDGDVSGNHGIYDYWVLKINLTIPTAAWKYCFGGTSADEACFVIDTIDGGFIIAGSAYSNDGNVSGNNGKYDYWLVKLNSNGGITWQKCFGGEEVEIATRIKQTSDGGYIVSGFSNSSTGDFSTNHGDYDAWIIKLDENGDITWQKLLGGALKDEANDIVETSDNGFLLAGTTLSNDGDVSGNHGNKDFWLVKLTNTGDFDWQKCLGGTEDDSAACFHQTTDGGYIAAGCTMSDDGDVSGNHGAIDYWIIKLDSIADITWQKCFGGTNNDTAVSLQKTVDSGFIVAGSTSSDDGNVSGLHGGTDCWIVKISSSGNMEWQKCYGGSGWDAAYSILQTTYGEYVFAGYTESTNGDVKDNHGNGDFWVVKIDSSGNIVKY